MASKKKRARSIKQESKFGFSTVKKGEYNPFDEKSVVEHMRSIYNKNKNDRRFATFRKKDYADNFLQYEIMANILGNENYIKLKESRHLDSDQVIDAVRRFTLHATEKDIENALLNIIAEINKVEKGKQAALNEALEVGFSAEDAMEYAELVAEDLGGLHPELGFQQLVDELTALVGKNEKREKIRNKLKNRRKKR